MNIYRCYHGNSIVHDQSVPYVDFPTNTFVSERNLCAICYTFNSVKRIVHNYYQIPFIFLSNPSIESAIFILFYPEHQQQLLLQFHCLLLQDSCHFHLHCNRIQAENNYDQINNVYLQN